MGELGLAKDLVHQVYFLVYEHHFSHFKDGTFSRFKVSNNLPVEEETQVSMTYIKSKDSKINLAHEQ